MVDVHTAADAARRVLADEALSRRLREGARDVFRDLVCADCLNRFLLELLGALRGRFRREEVVLCLRVSLGYRPAFRFREAPGILLRPLGSDSLILEFS